MQPEAWVVAGGALATVRTYFHYRMKVVEHQHSRNLEIEDQRSRNNAGLVDQLQAIKKELKETAAALEVRLASLEKRLNVVDEDLKTTTDWVQKVNRFFEKREAEKSEAKVIAPNVTRVSTKKSSDGG